MQSITLHALSKNQPKEISVAMCELDHDVLRNRNTISMGHIYGMENDLTSFFENSCDRVTKFLIIEECMNIHYRLFVYAETLRKQDVIKSFTLVQILRFSSMVRP